VYVIDTNTVELTNEKLIDKLKIIRKRISERGKTECLFLFMSSHLLGDKWA